MVFFKDGLNEEELKKEYRRLAKIYHPDISKDPNATEIMKELNEQFDKYFVNQRIREFSWVDTTKAKEQAQKIRRTLLVYLLRDRENPGKFFSIVERRSTGFWFWRETRKIKGITDDSKDWDGFRGGFAYCGYGDPDEFDEVSLKKLPAKLTPASLPEVYWYSKDHWSDGEYTTWYQIQCRFGTYWATAELIGFVFYMKAELPEEFLRIGNLNAREEEMYAAREIKTVFVNERWIPEHKVLQVIKGSDIRFLLYQDCTKDDFYKYHDVDFTPNFAAATKAKEVGDYWWISDPMIFYYASKGIVKFYQSGFDFRRRFGTFDSYALRDNLHLLSIEDAEAIQDFLDEINADYDAHVKSLIKRGKIRIKV